MCHFKNLILCLGLGLSALYGQEAEVAPSPVPATELTISEESPTEQVTFILEDEEPIKNYSYWHEFFKMMLNLGVLLGAVLTLAWLLRGYLNKRVKTINEGHSIKILERRSLSQKSYLFLVEVDDKRLLIADSQNGGVQLLTACTSTEKEIKEEIKPYKHLEKSSSFSDILQKKIKRVNLAPFFQPKSKKTPHDP